MYSDSVIRIANLTHSAVAGEDGNKSSLDDNIFSRPTGAGRRSDC